MLHYPDTMAKGQAELDRVIGRDRLPEFDDMSSLPYLNALIKETMRWRTIAHMGVPHSLMEDDVYEGKVIPKGTTVIASI
jgi:cytochrome P450